MTNTLNLLPISNEAADDDDPQQFMLNQLTNLIAEQEEFLQRLSLEKKINQKDLQVARNCTEKDTLHTVVLKFHNSVHHQFRTKERSDRHGMGKFSNKVSTSAASVQGFFDTYSGISEIIRGVDNKFGPIAYGTFSIFLTVAQSKRVHSRLTRDILEELDKWLSRLGVISITERGHSRLILFVFDIYIETVHFFRYATEFFCSDRKSRIWKLISRPPQHELKERLESIKLKGQAFMHELTCRLYEQNNDIAGRLATVERASNDQAELAKRNMINNYHDQMQQVAKVLNLPSHFDDCVASMIAHCDSEAYQIPFQYQRKAAFPLVRLQQISLEALSQRTTYADWLNTSRSSLLILGGENRDISIPQSWLSPVAVKLFHFVQRSQECIVIFHSINALRRWNSYKTSEHEVLLALKSILYQLISKNTRLCQSFAEDPFLSDPWDNADAADDEQVEMHIQSCVNMLSKVLSLKHLESPTIFIILDGVERLSEPAPRILFECILELLSECDEQARIKVVTICSVLGLSNIKGSKDQAGLRYALGQGGNKQLMERIFADLFWNQPVLEGSYS